MFQLELTTPPDYFDEYGRPCYLVEQSKGLFEQQSSHLFEDALAEGYTVSITNELKQWIVDEVALKSADRKLDLLEIGGSRGTLFEWVKDSARTYINVDPGRVTPRAGDAERWQNPRYAGIGCTAEAIPLEDESVDVVISMASFDHIPDYRRALSEVGRLLRKDGVFLMTLNNRRSWWKTLLSGTSYLRRREEEVAKEHYFQWSLSECEAHLSIDLSVKHMSTRIFLPYVPKIWPYLLPVSNAVGGAVAPKHGGFIIARCRKRGS